MKTQKSSPDIDSWMRRRCESNYGKAGQDSRDIYPPEFHRVLSYYIGELGKVVAIDYLASRTVDNHLISGYNFKIVRQSLGSYTVTAALTVHRYDSSSKMAPGTAPAYTRTYKYNLRVNSEGKIISGTWLTTNPDFLWVPLSPKDCSSNNPRMSAQYVTEILNLPSVARED